MSHWEAYAWGCAGGGVAAFFVYVIPNLTHAALTGDQSRYSRRGVVVLVIFLIVYATAAGVVALIPDHVTRGGAIMYGAAAQTIAKGLFSAGMDAIHTDQPG